METKDESPPVPPGYTSDRGTAFFALLFCGVGLLIGFAWGKYCERSRALDAGAAEWRIDSKSGERSFHYLLPGDSPRP